jgi:hypothetical protein
MHEKLNDIHIHPNTYQNNRSSKSPRDPFPAAMGCGSSAI